MLSLIHSFLLLRNSSWSAFDPYETELLTMGWLTEEKKNRKHNLKTES